VSELKREYMLVWIIDKDEESPRKIPAFWDISLS
jgi:hypothetical protein